MISCTKHRPHGNMTCPICIRDTNELVGDGVETFKAADDRFFADIHSKPEGEREICRQLSPDEEEAHFDRLKKKYCGGQSGSIADRIAEELEDSKEDKKPKKQASSKLVSINNRLLAMEDEISDLRLESDHWDVDELEEGIQALVLLTQNMIDDEEDDRTHGLV